jgi:predicted transcriptional regulator
MIRKKLPNWIEKRYALLWKGKADKRFSFDDAVELLSNDKKPIVSIALSEMRRAGWLKVETNEKDTRKRFYRLVSIDEYVKMIVSQIETLKK